jgi:hypothetical protein
MSADPGTPNTPLARRQAARRLSYSSDQPGSTLTETFAIEAEDSIFSQVRELKTNVEELTALLAETISANTKAQVAQAAQAEASQAALLSQIILLTTPPTTTTPATASKATAPPTTATPTTAPPTTATPAQATTSPATRLTTATPSSAEISRLSAILKQGNPVLQTGGPQVHLEYPSANLQLLLNFKQHDEDLFSCGKRFTTNCPSLFYRCLLTSGRFALMPAAHLLQGSVLQELKHRPR